MSLDDFIFPEEGHKQYFVECSESTGSSWDGTRQHYWTVVPLTRAVRASNVSRIYDTREEAEAVADDKTARNVAP